MPVNIDSICKTSFGAHYSLLYRYREDLVDFLVRYFLQGIDNGEYCMWVTPDTELQRIARMKLAENMSADYDLNQTRSIRFVNAREWYLRNGGFDSCQVCNSWTEMPSAINSGHYKGMRVSGDLGWCHDENWRSLMEYETQINMDIPKSNFIAVCSYPLGNLKAAQVADIIKRHQLVIAKDRGDWQVFNTINQQNMPHFIEEAGGLPGLKLKNDIIFSYPVVYPEKCNGCGICIDVCQRGLLYLDGGKINVRTNSYCDWCTNCEAVCPTGAISCPFDIS
jgi:NAD-dependent dihydropyrimidine dehydrogenase PreA subunit